MMARRFITFITLFLSFGATASALTAVCKNATGHIMGVHGKALGGKTFDEPDGISNATFTVLWNRGDTEAKIVTQSSGGGAPTAERALRVFETDEQLTFIVFYESAVWFYSIFPGPRVLLMTSHNNGASIDSGGAVMKSFQADCEIGD